MTTVTEGQAAALRPHDEEALERLRFDWDEAYDITWTPEDGWQAERRDGLGELSAGSAGSLRDMIRADYVVTPVPREFAPVRP